MKPVQLLALLLAAACAQATAQTERSAPPSGRTATETEEIAMMNRIEREIRLPRGANPLAAYERYYAWQQRKDAGRTVIAVYVGARNGAGARHWVAEAALPVIDDGGCDIISLRYDVAAGRFDQIGCNGYA